MNEFIIIDVMNEAMINVLKEKNVDCSQNLKIAEQLKDKALFFKINKEEAFSILLNVGIKKEKLEDAYSKLISTEVFYDLVNKGIIDINDNTLKIKYNLYRKW